MAYHAIQFIETRLFTRQVLSLLEESRYLALQQYLMITPDAGVVIRGTHGLRKVRWGIEGKGKRGGVRLIYYYEADTATVYMLYMYAKSDADDLTAEQAKLLSDLVAREMK